MSQYNSFSFFSDEAGFHNSGRITSCINDDDGLHLMFKSSSAPTFKILFYNSINYVNIKMILCE